MTSLLFDQGEPGRGSDFVAPAGVPADYLDADLLRTDLPLPDLAELEVTRHFVALSHRNFSVDTNFYPLGSCTMKYNPKLNEAVSAFGGFTDLHPLAPDSVSQGSLRLIWTLERALASLFGMEAFSL